MRQSLFLAAMLCLTPMLAGCLDSLTGDEELRTGCTYTEAENWDPLAQIDDGSCDLGLEGCTYEGAENYNPLFVVDDGTCVFADPVVGCMDYMASNYNPYAEYDDDSCVYQLGCTYDDADNYDSSAQVDDGTCEFADPVTGCTDDSATNYNQYAEYDDDSCEYIIYGCMDSGAENYDAEVDVDDGSCEYSGCTYEDAWNYDSDATVDDGSCEFPDPVLGCTDDAAANYNPYATIDDDSCYYLYASLTSEAFNDFGDLWTEQEDFTLWADDFDRFGTEMKINVMAIMEEMEEGGEGGDNETEDEEEMPEEVYAVLGMQKDDENQIFTATFGMEASMGGDFMEMGTEDAEGKMSFRMTSVRQGLGCTSGDCTLTNEVMEMSIYADAEGPGTQMIMSMYMFATTYSRDMVPYYGDPVAELPGGGSFFLGQMDEEKVEIIRDGEDVMFSPAEIEIEIDTTIIWYNGDNTTHTVTADDGTFDSGDIYPDSEWRYTFEEVGEYAYYSDKEEDRPPLGDLTGKVVVTEREPLDLDWETEAGVGLDSDDDGEDDWIEYYAHAWDDEENMSIDATLTQNIETGKLYPRYLEFHNETGALVMAFEYWYGDEVHIELNEDEDLEKSAIQFYWDAESYDDDENSQNVYEGTISEGNGNYMQEAHDYEIEIRVLENYEGSDDEGPSIDPFGGGDDEEGGRENARVAASMVLSHGEDDMVDSETGCHWYITWNDNDEDGLVSVNDTYEIRSDKFDSAGETCNREDENGNATYVIQFFDLWADAYVDGPNPALAPGFTGLFAAFAIAGLAGLRRRRR